MANPPRVTIIGCGPGGAGYVSPAARSAAAEADVLIGSSRLLDLFADLPCRKVALPGNVEATVAEIRSAGPDARVGVLVSGDVGLSSLAQPLLKALGREACRLIPGVSCLQAAYAALCLDWMHARILNAHGRDPGDAAEAVAGCETAAILCGTRESVAWAAQAAKVVAKSHHAFLCENLTMPDQHVREVTPAQLAREAGAASSLSLVVLARKERME